MQPYYVSLTGTQPVIEIIAERIGNIVSYLHACELQKSLKINPHN